jgi:hypothetical protein
MVKGKQELMKRASPIKITKTLKSKLLTFLLIKILIKIGMFQQPLLLLDFRKAKLQI